MPTFDEIFEFETLPLDFSTVDETGAIDSKRKYII